MKVKTTITVFVLMLVLLLSAPGFAEEDTLNKVLDQVILQLEEARLGVADTETPDTATPRRRFGLMANWGPLVTAMPLDVGELNRLLTGEGFAGVNDRMYLLGNSWVVGTRAGRRIGGLSSSGTLTAIEDDKQVDLAVNYSGLFYEGSLYSWDKTTLGLGALVGRGNMKLDLLYERPSSFTELIEKPHLSNLERTFLFAEPRLTLHHKLGTFTNVQLSAGYLLAHDFNQGWNLNGNLVASGPMASLYTPTISLRFSLGF